MSKPKKYVLKNGRAYYAGVTDIILIAEGWELTIEGGIIVNAFNKTVTITTIKERLAPAVKK